MLAFPLVNAYHSDGTFCLRLPEKFVKQIIVSWLDNPLDNPPNPAHHTKTTY